MMAEPFVTCDGLVKIYKVADLEVVALGGLDLVVDQGEMMGIVGSSGSGKSTLMNILGGLDRPSAGAVSVGGVDLLKLSESGLTRYRRSQVGFVWQQVSRNLVPYLTARENIELPMTIAGYSPRRKRMRSEQLLESVGLLERRHHHLAQLSGGEQQRIAIAVALAHEPSLLLADEPTGEMDTATAQTIFDTLRRINQAHGLTTIIVTHDPRIAGQVHRVVAIRDGRTSSEIVRQASQVVRAMVGDATEADLVDSEDEMVHYEEYVVLDKAGRLQLPEEYREQLGIRERATVELTDEGILIRPVDGQDLRSNGTTERELSGASLFRDEEPPPAKSSGLLGKMRSLSATLTGQRRPRRR